MRIYALVTFDLAAWLPTPCAGWLYYHTLLMATLLPLYLVLVVALVSLCSRDPDAKQRACRRLAVLLIMCHATVCSVLFEFFHLDGVEYHTADERGFRTSATERELYLARDYTIRASSKRYQAYRAYAILCCLIYVVGLPGLFFTVLLPNFAKLLPNFAKLLPNVGRSSRSPPKFQTFLPSSSQISNVPPVLLSNFKQTNKQTN